jgi:hypothetical protein
MNKKRLTIVIISVISVILISFGYYFFYKATHIGLACPIHEMFHVDCPGCGLSRMIFSIIELDFYQAFRYNPLMFVLSPFIIVFAVDLIIAFIHDRKSKIVSKIPLFAWIIIYVVILVFGVIRNIEPFTYLKVTEVRENR